MLIFISGPYTGPEPILNTRRAVSIGIELMQIGHEVFIKLLRRLIAFDGDTVDGATGRLEAVWRLGGCPFAQLYQPPDHYIGYSQEWRDLARRWSRPAIMASSQGGWLE